MDFYILPQLMLTAASRQRITLVLNWSLVWIFSSSMLLFPFLSCYCNSWFPVGHKIVLNWLYLL